MNNKLISILIVSILLFSCSFDHKNNDIGYILIPRNIIQQHYLFKEYITTLAYCNMTYIFINDFYPHKNKLNKDKEKTLDKILKSSFCNLKKNKKFCSIIPKEDRLFFLNKYCNYERRDIKKDLDKCERFFYGFCLGNISYEFCFKFKLWNMVLKEKEYYYDNFYCAINSDIYILNKNENSDLISLSRYVVNPYKNKILKGNSKNYIDLKTMSKSFKYYREYRLKIK